MILDIDGTVFGLRLTEEGVHTRGRWEEQVRRYRHVDRESIFYRDRDLPSGPYDAGATGRLTLVINGSCRADFAGRQSRWSDRQAWTLEERLPYVFRELEARRVLVIRATEQARIEADHAEERARLAAEERERQWHVLMTQARERMTLEHRAAHLRSEAERWQEAEMLRRYCDAAEAKHGEVPTTAAWVQWARCYADQTDPLGKPPSIPASPDETAEALNRYLPPGWSAHGPGAGRRFS